MAQFFTRPPSGWDSKGLELTDFTLDVAVKNGVATATIDVRITNPTDVQTEAIIQLPVPPGAAVTGAKLWMGDKPMTGVLLGSAKAREIYEKIVDRRRDPLLVTWGTSDTLKLSIFPLEANQTRRFTLTWVEPAASDKQYVPSFHNDGTVVGFPKQILVNGEPAKRDGIWVAIPRTKPAVAGDFRIQIQQATKLTSVALVLDTSAGNSVKRDQTWKDVEGLVAALDSKTAVSAVAADWILQELDLETAKEPFMAIRPAGLFDQEQAFAWAAEKAGPTGAIAVLSNQRPSATKTSVGAPVYWVGVNAWPYEPDVVDRSGGRWAPTGADLASTLRPLVRPTDKGFEWLPLQAATGHVAWLGYKTDAKVDSEAPATPREALFYRAMLRRSEIPLNKIVSPYTSILVLESEEHYKRWGVKDKDGKLVRDKAGSNDTISGLIGQPSDGSLGGFSGVDPSGTGWGTIGTGKYGTIGHGSGIGSGYGTGSGRGGMRGRRASPPRIRIGNAIVGGNLDKNIIRRYIRRKLPRIRYCYEKELLRRDSLTGTVTAEFIITAEGKVASVTATMDHKKGKAVAACVKATIQSIQFPKPKGGGIVKVKYPFLMLPGPATLWSKALKITDDGTPKYEKKLGAVFGFKGATSRAQLAWWLAENQMRNRDTPASGYRIVAELLRGGESPTARDKDDARRLLSEGARRYPALVAELFSEWGHAGDAERVKKLSPQGGGLGRGIGTIGSGR